MPLSLPVGSAHDAASKIHDDAMPDRYLKRFSDQLWWITPVYSANAKAYRYGKYVFDCRPHIAESGTVFCGINLEKGYTVEPSLGGAEAITDDWMWCRFLDDIDDKVPKAVETATRLLGADMYVKVVATKNEERGCVSFLSDGSRATLDSQSDDLRVLEGIQALRDWNSIASFIRAVPGEASRWEWFDVEIGLPFQLGGDDHSASCVQLLGCFREWFD